MNYEKKKKNENFKLVCSISQNILVQERKYGNVQYE